MPFLDKDGLIRLWDHTTAKINTKADKTAKLSEFENDLDIATPGMLTDAVEELEASIAEVEAKITTVNYPVTSVNSKTGAVVLTAADVGALPATTQIPSIAGLATQTYVDAELAKKSDAGHSHTIAAGATDDDVIILTGTQGDDAVSYDAKHAKTNKAGTYTKVTVNDYGHVTGGSNPTTLSGYGITDAYTKTQVDTELAKKADDGHEHTIYADGTGDGVVNITGTEGDNSVTYTVSHSASGVTAGTYKSVTVDAKGHVTGGSNPTTLSGYGITDAYTKTEVNNEINDLEAAITAVENKIPTVNYPVKSVNGKTGAVVLSAADVGALPSTTAIPSIEGLATEDYVNTELAKKADSGHSHTIYANAEDDDVVVLTGTQGTNTVSYKATHANSGVTAGTYRSVTVNAKGHVTGGTNPTTLSGYKISDAYTKTEVDSAVAAVEAKIPEVKYPVTSVNGQTGAVTLSIPSISGLAKTTEVNNLISTHNTSTDAHDDIRAEVAAVNAKLEAFLDVDDTAVDQLSEVLAMIETNEGTLESLTSTKVNKSDIANNLTTTTAGKVLDATQGKALKDQIDTHAANAEVHVTAAERAQWNKAQANQNAFSNVKVGDTTVAADSTTDTLTLVGSNITITPDATNDKITFTVASGSTSAKGIVQLTDSVTSTSTSLAATANSVKTAYDAAEEAKAAAADAAGKATDHTHTVSHTPAGTVGSKSITPAGTVGSKSLTPAGSNSKTSITPAGTVTVSTAAPTSGQTATYTPAGSVTSSFTGTAASHGHTFTGTAASHNHGFTGTAATLTAEYTPEGSVSQPTFTGTAATSGKPDTTNVTSIYSITGVGTLPSHSYTAPSHSYTAPSLTSAIANRGMTVTFSAGTHTFDAGSHSFSAGSLPTRSSAISMPNANHTHSVTATGTVSKPTFTGTAAEISIDYTPAGTVGSKSVTPAGTISSTSVTPAGSVSSSFSGTGRMINASFTGTAAEHTHTFTGTAASHDHSFTGTAASHDHSFTGTSATITTSTGE